MTKKTNASRVEELANEAANLPINTDRTLSDEVSDLMARLAQENDVLKQEMAAMKKRVTSTMKMGKEELKSEIAHHPVQSVLTAFALGVVVSLVARR
ncbi:hypothetical protein [Pseudaestuariivita atlantica]|uniref:DUF883 domain-containing protein n=1 Tax=Pseudaestuariivita atlantica TaxID=1317121 RepID=A0A0L1JK72_9RHOB|nr:hypothetical protein [Pseudaestuariivita atlantica]KNG92117.1 hypothetical protein ATO11_19155 [Pseudaestuariivita atlantica]